MRLQGNCWEGVYKPRVTYTAQWRTLARRCASFLAQLLDDVALHHGCGTTSPDSVIVSVASTGASGSPVSVVVPALNEERHIGRLLGDVRCQTRRPREVIVVDAGSRDTTVAVAQGFTGVRILHGVPPVASGRNLGGRSASGDVVIFLDADTRLPEEFLERFVEDFLRRELEVACPMYAPHDSTPAVERFHRVFNLVTKTCQGILPSGAGICLAVRGDLFRRSQGFDPGLKFDDIELIRRLSRGRRFGIVEEKVFVSDRRYRERGVTRAILEYALMALIFALGRFEWANHLDYEFGNHAP